MKSVLQRVARWGWRLFIAFLVSIILIVGGARLLVAFLPLLQQHITQYLSEQLKTSLYVDKLSAEWAEGRPALSIRGLKLQGRDAEKPGFSVDRLDLSLDLRSSLLYRTPVFNHLEIDGASLEIVDQGQQRWGISGIDGSIGAIEERNSGRPSLLNWLQLQSTIDITNISLAIIHSGESVTQFKTPYFSLVETRGMKQLSTRLEFSDGFIEVSGRGQGVDLWSMGWTGSIVAHSLNAEHLCALWSGCNDRVQKAVITSDLSWRYQNGDWQLYGGVSVPELTYQTPAAVSHKLRGDSNVFLEGKKGKNWKFWLNQLSITMDQQSTYDAGDWYMTGETRPEYSITMASSNLDLSRLKVFLLQADLLPELPQKLLSVLNPEGSLKDLVMRLYPGRKPFDFDLQARLADVSVDAWEDAPSAKHVSGKLRMGLLKGSLLLDSSDFNLGLSRVFRDVWHYNSAKARLYWDVVDDTYILRGDRIQLDGAEGQLTGQLRLDIPLLDEQPVEMALTVGMKEGNAQYTGKYLPAKLDALSPQLVDWLDSAIKQADIDEGGFLYNGVLSGGEKGSSRWGLFFDVENARLNYHPDWPEVHGMAGDVYVNNDQVEVLARRGEVMGVNLDKTAVTVPLDKDPVVSIRGASNVRGSTLHKFLTKTPVNQLMGGEAEKWQLSGDLDAALKIDIPIQHVQDSDVLVRAQLDDFQFGIPEYNIAVEEINGPISFSTHNGLWAKRLKGRFLEHPIEADIKTTVENKKFKKTAIHWDGHVDREPLQQWLELDMLSLLEGNAEYGADLQINHEASALKLSVNSDLKGVEVDLPAPVGKSPDSIQPLRMALEAQAEDKWLSFNLAGIGRGKFQLAGNAIKEGVVFLDPETRDSKPLEDGLPGKITVAGRLPELDIKAWCKRFEYQPVSADARSFFGLLNVDKIQVDKPRYGDTTWENLQVSFQPDSEFLKLTVDSDFLTGSLWIPGRESVPYRLAIDHLVLPEPDQGEKPVEGKTDRLFSMSPLAIPAVDVSIESLSMGEKIKGQLAMKLRKVPSGLRIESIDGNLSNMELSGSADWTEHNGVQHTYYQGLLKGGHIDEIFELFGSPPFIQAKESRISSRLNWPGSPMDMAFADLSGTVALDLNNGRLKKLEGGAGALKLFGILNTESLNRRLKLDFSDLYSSGVSFDDLHGTLRLSQGVATFDSPIVIEGSSSNFKLDGLIDSVSESMDVSLVVTLPVSSNLPIFSVLLGAAPQVAGIFYIADKLVGKQVDQLASIRYRIEGSFDEPRVSLDQLFSNKAVKPGKQSTPMEKGVKNKSKQK